MFTHSQMAANVFNKHAHAYQEKYMNVDLYAPTLDLFCSSIANPQAHILDIACGPGNITRYLLARHPHFHILGIDIADKMLALATTNVPAATFRHMDARHISQLTGRYHGIMCGFCLPYLAKEEALQLIQDAALLLLPGGVLYISTMEDDYTRSGITHSSSGDEVYMYYHEAGYLTAALTARGFTIITQQRQPFPTTDGTAVTDLVLIARK